MKKVHKLEGFDTDTIWMLAAARFAQGVPLRDALHAAAIDLLDVRAAPRIAKDAVTVVVKSESSIDVIDHRGS